MKYYVTTARSLLGEESESPQRRRKLQIGECLSNLFSHDQTAVKQGMAFGLLPSADL